MYRQHSLNSNLLSIDVKRIMIKHWITLARKRRLGTWCVHACVLVVFSSHPYDEMNYLFYYTFNVFGLANSLRTLCLRASMTYIYIETSSENRMCLMTMLAAIEYICILISTSHKHIHISPNFMRALMSETDFQNWFDFYLDLIMNFESH